MTSRSDFTGNTSIPLTMAASRALTSGTISFWIFRLRASIAIGSVPRTPRIPPSSESSPTNTQSSGSLFVEPAVSAQNSKRHGQIKARTFLANVGRGQIHGDVRGRDIAVRLVEHGYPEAPDEAWATPFRRSLPLSVGRVSTQTRWLWSRAGVMSRRVIRRISHTREFPHSVLRLSRCQKSM